MRAPDINRAVLFAIAVVIGYFTSYLGFRATHREVWGPDGRTHLVIESKFTRSFFGPITRMDTELTGIVIHYGPHP